MEINVLIDKYTVAPNTTAEYMYLDLFHVYCDK